MAYIIDTNSLIDASIKWYNPAVFKSLWPKLSNCNDIFLTEQVCNEIKSPDMLVKWVDSFNKQRIIKVDQQAVNEYRNVINRIVKLKYWTESGISQWTASPTKADPWLIAMAIVHNCTIVTMDGITNRIGQSRKIRGLPNKNSPSSVEPKIAPVANLFGIETITIYELLVKLKFTF